MSFRILDVDNAADGARWQSLWRAWREREVFAHPEYVRLYAQGRTRGLCATWESAKQCVLYPFLVRDLADEPFWNGPAGVLFDLASAYGYAGPFVWGEGDRAGVANCFWAEFRRWAMDHDIVSEFVRFSLFPGGQLPYPGETWKAAGHAVRSLDASEPVLWAEFEHKVRKNVNHAMRAGVRIEIDETGSLLADFLRILKGTLDRRHALDCYYFPRAYFEQLQARLPGQFVYFHAVLGGRVVSSELVLVSERSVYSFLGGTSQEDFACRPNELLKLEIIRWAKHRGKRSFVLGGGYQPGDGIFRYKSAFAPHGETPYFLGGQIFSRERQQDLMARRKRFASERGEEWSPRAGFFPAYRS
jgi:hypothetical protein